MKHALIGAALVVAAFSALPARAQTIAPGASIPAGISIAATASVTPTAFVEEIPFVRKATGNDTDGARAVAQFRAALTTAGVPSGAILAATPFVATTASLVPMAASSTDTTIAVATLRIDPNRLAAVVKALAGVHWTPATSGARIVPVDEEALEDQALAKATAVARHRAEAIASSEGRHVGRLLNVAPQTLDFLDSFLDDLSRLSPMFGSGGVPQVKAGGVFTFELLP